MAAYNAYSREIDNDVLISEVKARPALYDRSIKEYNDIAFKKTMWEEISRKLYPDIWNELNETQREIRGADVLKRWNNLRTCFARELKILRDPLKHKRRKYVYFDKLLFIDEDAAHFHKAEPSFVYTKSSSLDKFEDESHLSEKSPERKVKDKATKGKQARTKEGKKRNRTEDIQVEPAKTFDTDADSNFALSLVPMLKLIPIDKKIDAQIELLSVLKKYTSKITCEFNIVKYEKEDEQMSDADDESEILCLFGDEK